MGKPIVMTNVESKLLIIIPAIKNKFGKHKHNLSSSSQHKATSSVSDSGKKKMISTDLFYPTCHYSPDLAPTDHHLFRSLQNDLIGNNFSNENGLKISLELFNMKTRGIFITKGIIITDSRAKRIRLVQK